MTELPVACSLDPTGLTARRAGLLAELSRVAATRSALEHGYRLTFDASSDTLALVTRAIDAERQCCRFLRFALTIEPAGGSFVLELSGPAGTREFLTDLLGPA